MSGTEDLPTAAGTYDADEADRVEQALPLRPDEEEAADWTPSEPGVTEADAADVAEQHRPVPTDPAEDEPG